MVLYCWVCKQSQCSNQKLTLHRFPTDANERAVWFENLGLKQYPENTLKYARICSVHFEGEAFEVKPSGKIFLKKGARPLSFNHEYIPPTSRKDDSSTDSTDTASENNFLEVDKSTDGPPLKRLLCLSQHLNFSKGCLRVPELKNIRQHLDHLLQL
ncbi:uncharacterized protein isoform X2 [Leptinotarsa decemlineata]|uniref:uncharacterized protein isoform X2 n=1 Tax=Leptinotarsa decemlineata TaxID=7539 RepID=UPI003D309605